LDIQLLEMTTGWLTLKWIVNNLADDLGLVMVADTEIVIISL
jgi:hypothetical protein